jgi:predicted MPP superfamily phosphohydrolase
MLSLYALVNFYVCKRGWQALPDNKWVKISYLVVFLFLALSYLLSRFLDRTEFLKTASFFNWIGSFWLIAFLYFFLIIVSIDLIRILNSFLHFIPAVVYKFYPQTKMYLALGSVLVVAGLLIGGYINTLFPAIKKFEITTDKNIGKTGRLRIITVSDTHFGSTVNAKRVNYLVEKVNEMNPDIMIFAGDIIDEEINSVIKNNIADNLRNIKARYGVYAITGNHEYIGGIDATSKYIQSHNIKLLRDEVEFVADSTVCLVGRNDRDMKRFISNDRMPLETLMEKADKSKFIVLLDHQPFNLEQTEKNNVDLQISGHTHHGQFWPISIVTNSMYELDWGFMKKGNSNIYVSCGFGTWGPPVRIGNRPEIVVFDIVGSLVKK